MNWHVNQDNDIKGTILNIWQLTIEFPPGPRKSENTEESKGAVWVTLNDAKEEYRMLSRYSLFP